MDLFHMQRFVPDEEKEDVDTTIADEIKENLKKKLKKRSKQTFSESQTVEVVKDEDQDSVDDVQNEEKQQKQRKRKKKPKKTKVAEEVMNEFTPLGQNVFGQAKKVKRMLPEWLANPDIVSVDYKESQLAVDDLRCLDSVVLEKCKENKITHFFPVQRQVIPKLLSYNVFYPPNDICVSAPTGSGKTLAFVLPIVQVLKKRLVPRIRALVVLPVQDLALQVFKVFQTFSEGTGLRVKLLTPQKSFSQEQVELVKEGVDGFHSLADVVVATPGRLVDHIQKTKGFCLNHLQYLIIDEADRVMQDIQNDWLLHVENAVYSNPELRKRPGPLNLKSINQYRKSGQFLQKLLFSATLSQNPEQLLEMNLFEPKLYACIVKPKDIVQSKIDAGKAFSGDLMTPAELNEQFVAIKDSQKKPLVLNCLLEERQMKKIMVFTKSIEHTHYLATLLTQFGHKVGELSSKLHKKRTTVLNQLNYGKINVLVCTDALARGIDIGHIDYVVSYDVPSYAKTHVHRIGRTARAGASGHAITLVEKHEQAKFKGILKELGKENVTELVEDEILDNDDAQLRYEEACKKASAVLEAERVALKKKKKRNTRKTKFSKSKNAQRAEAD